MSSVTIRVQTPWLGAIVVTIAAAGLYFLTAARDIVVGDTPELITAAANLGVAHEPGYPLFTMLGHLFSMVPCGPLPFRINLLSVVCDAFTVGVTYVITFRLTKSQLAATVASLLLAVNPTFWKWSIVAEVFPLNNFLASILILLLITWHERSERSILLIGAFFIAGLGLTNHQTIVLLAPAFCFILWRRRSTLWARPHLIAIGIVGFVIGLLPYAYIPWASAHNPTYNWGDVSSIGDLISVVTRQDYGSGNLARMREYWGGWPFARIAALVASLSPISIVLILIGAVATFTLARWYFWFSLITFVFAGPFFAWISNLSLDVAPSALFVLERFFLLSHVILAPLGGFGILWTAQWLSNRISKFGIDYMRLLSAIALLAISIDVLTNYRRLDQSRNSIERRFAEDIFATAEPRSILLARGDIAFALMYFQKVEHIGTENDLILLPLLAMKWYVKQIHERQPDFVIPFDQYDLVENNLKKFVEANSNRQICVVGTLGNEDRSLTKDYWPYQRGLLLVIEPQSKNIPLQNMLTENEEIMKRYQPPDFSTVRTSTFEADILNMYAWPPFQIGNDCAQVGLTNEAKKWYHRALRINPQFSQAREALARLEH